MISATSSPNTSSFLSPPIHDLPNELLASIFLRISNWNARGLSQVCSRWREVALGYPVLWMNLWIQMLNYNLECPEWNEELLRRSQGLLIDIGNRRESSRIVHIRRALAQSCRWRTFAVELTYIDDALIPALSRPAPHLEVFRVSVPLSMELEVPAFLFANDVPNLRVLDLFRCSFNPSNNFSIFGNLTTIIVIGMSGPKVARWLQVLHAASLLEDIWIDRAIAPSAAAETLLQVNLPNLSRIRLAGLTAECNQLLGHLNAPSLSNLFLQCSFIHQNNDIKAILRFVEARFGWGRPDFDNGGCRASLSGSGFLAMEHKPQESGTDTPHLIISFDGSRLTNAENIMSPLVHPLLMALHTLILQTTHLTVVGSRGSPFPGLSVLTSIVLATFRNVRTLKMSEELQRIVFTLLLSVTPPCPDGDLEFLLPSLRKLELNSMDFEKSRVQQGARPLFDVLVDVIRDRIKKGVIIDAVEFGSVNCLSSDQQVDILKGLGVQVQWKKAFQWKRGI